MNIEKLKTFCETGSFRGLHEVMLCNGKAVATNGNILMLSNDDLDVKKDCLESIEKYVAYLDSYDFSQCKEYDVAVPPHDVCSACDGLGYTKLIECPECDGEGEVSVSNQYSTYHDLECATCDGSGRISSPTGQKTECERCDGAGELVHPAYWPIILEGVPPFSWNLYKEIKDLNGLKIGAFELQGRDGIVFSFNGGCGILMGIKV